MTEHKGFHEDFGREDGPKPGSERSFGIVFTVVFVLIGSWPLFDGGPFRLWALAGAGIFLAAGLFFPTPLRPLNRLWFIFGMALHKVMSPLVMDFLTELWAFMRVRKKFWLLPVFVMMAVFGGLVVLSQGSAVAPFIYTIF